MNKSKTLTLIDGQFDHEEAKGILMNIFSTKIQFHELKNFSSHERFGEDDNNAKIRIPELKKSMIALEDILAEAKIFNKKMMVKSEVTITFFDE